MKMVSDKWVIGFKGWRCSCGLVFFHYMHFQEHLRDTKRWRDRHYSPDYKQGGTHGYVVFRKEVKK